MSAQRIRKPELKKSELQARVRILTEALSSITTGQSVTLAFAFEEWLLYAKENCQSPNTYDRLRRDCRHFVESFSDKDSLLVKNITAQQINNWVNSEGPSKSSTRALWLNSVRTFFRFCMEKSYVQLDPSRFSIVRIDHRKLSHEQKEPRYQEGFTDDQVEKLITYCNEGMIKMEERKKYCDEHDIILIIPEEQEWSNYKFFRAAIPLMRWAGLRISDVCKLEWACFSKPGRIVVWTVKRNRRVELELSQRMMDAIAWIEITDEKYCFPREKKMIESSKRTKLPILFASWCDKLDIPCTSMHQLRHEFAKDCLKQGITMPHIASMLGHMSEETTKIYTTHHEKQIDQTTEGNPIQTMEVGGGVQNGPV